MGSLTSDELQLSPSRSSSEDFMGSIIEGKKGDAKYNLKFQLMANMVILATKSLIEKMTDDSQLCTLTTISCYGIGSGEFGFMKLLMDFEISVFSSYLTTAALFDFTME